MNRLLLVTMTFFTCLQLSLGQDENMYNKAIGGYAALEFSDLFEDFGGYNQPKLGVTLSPYLLLKNSPSLHHGISLELSYNFYKYEIPNFPDQSYEGNRRVTSFSVGYFFRKIFLPESKIKAFIQPSINLGMSLDNENDGRGMENKTNYIHGILKFRPGIRYDINERWSTIALVGSSYIIFNSIKSDTADKRNNNLNGNLEVSLSAIDLGLEYNF